MQKGGGILAGDFSAYVVEGMGVAIVFEGPGFDPPLAKRAVGGVPNPSRSFHLGVEVAGVDVSCVGRHPPEA